MSNFEFLSVLFAIILGIGFAHLLLSIGRILGEVFQLAKLVPLLRQQGRILVLGKETVLVGAEIGQFRHNQALSGFRPGCWLGWVK